MDLPLLLQYVFTALLQGGDGSQSAPLVVRTSQSGIIPDTQNMIGLSELIPDNKEIDPTFQVINAAIFDIFAILSVFPWEGVVIRL